MFFHKHVLTICLLLSVVAVAIGQVNLDSDRFAFESHLPYNNDIQSPSEYLGYDMGESFTLYANVTSYFKYLAESSDRLMLTEYGETYEGRKLYTAVISSPENLARIDELKADNIALGDPRNISNARAQQIISEKPVFVSYSYNIHGNEASGTEAALQVSYRFAAAEDRETEDILDNSVLIFYICINPDGRDRYVYWYEGVKRSVVGVQPRDLDHYAPWPNGRTNHYWFDLNRDWIWGIHPESRGHTGEYVSWMPQIHTDYHEQGYNANYFTVPGTTPRNLLLPDNYEPLADTIGRANIAAFDQHRINYFTREAFDFFYPGYGSSYPSVMNAIGMLTEQGGIGAGQAVTTDDGQVLTLKQRVFDHYTTSVATIKKAVSQKELFNQYYHDSSNPKNSKSDTKSFLLINDGGPYLDEVTNILLHHDIEVYETAGKQKAANLYSYRTDQSESINVPDGSIIIHTDQPKHLLINSILSKQMIIEDSVMYDMATWSAPLAYNLEAYSSNRPINLKSDLLTEKNEEKGTVINRDASYAYVIDWNQRYAPKALGMLWDKGYRVRSSAEPFGDQDHSFHAGSLVILQGRNLDLKNSWQEDMDEIAANSGVTIIGMNTGRMTTGYDLAARSNKTLEQPRVALLVEPPFNTYTCGQLYYLFDQETELAVDRIRTSILAQTAMPKLGSRYGYANLDDYDVLILAGGGNNLSKIFEEEQQKQLKDWVSDGGVIVATESASSFFTKGNSIVGSAEIKKAITDSSDVAKYLKYANRTDYFGKKRIPGSALYGHVDVSHPLAFGLKEDLYSLSFNGTALVPNAQLETVVHYHQDPNKLLVSGYASDENLKHLAGLSSAAVERIGAGKIVHLVDNTQYRMFWRGPSRMMQNAVMLLPSF